MFLVVIVAVYGVAVTAACVWVAVLLLPGFRLVGSGGQQVLSVVVVGLGYTVLSKVLFLPLKAMFTEVQATVMDDAVDGGFLVAGRRMVAAIDFVQSVVRVGLTPVILWLATWFGGVIGLPIELSGFWQVVLAGLVVQALLTPLVELAVAEGKDRARTMDDLVEMAFWLAALAIAGWGHSKFDGGLDAGPVWQQWLTLVVLASGAVVLPLRPRLPLRPQSRRPNPVVHLAATAWILWLVCLISIPMEITLRVGGPTIFLVTALALAAVTYPVLKHRLQLQPPEPAITTGDPFMPDYRSPE